MNRLEHLDVMKGFALFMILLLHAYGSFGIYSSPTREFLSLGALDGAANHFINLFVRNKAFAIFSIMFGISFFIQLERSKFKDINFLGFFSWRLLILLGIGIVHAMIFRADILTKYAVVGFILLLIYRLPIVALALISFLMLMQPGNVYHLLRIYTDAGYIPANYHQPELWAQVYEASRTGSFLQVVNANVNIAFWELWKLNITTGRITNIIGFFALGFLIGKSRLLENPQKNMKVFYYIVALSSVFYIALRYFRNIMDGVSWVKPNAIPVFDTMITNYMNFYMVLIMLSVIVVLYHISIFKSLFDFLKPYGRMSLSSYVMQSVLGVFLFYGFGLGLHDFLGPFLSLVSAFLILTVLLVYANLRFRTHKQGPLEALWKKLTYMPFAVRSEK